MKPMRILMIVVLAGLLAGPHAARASGKHFTTINVPQAEMVERYGTWVTGINQRGDIVGYYSNEVDEYGFLLRQGRYTVIRYPAHGDTRLAGINRQGDIVGNYYLHSFFGFLLHKGKYRAILGPKAAGPLGLSVTGINARGDIVGQYRDGTGVFHGFLLHKGTYTVLDHPNASKVNWEGTFATGISDTGDVVGYYDGTYQGRVASHGFVLHHGKYTSFDAPKAAGKRETGNNRAGTYALGINQTGDIVGMFTDRTMLGHGFLLHQGKYTVLDYPGAAKARVSTIPLESGTRATGINSRGDVVGTYLDSSGASHGFLWR